MQEIPVCGIEIPRLGFGTFRVSDGGGQAIVESALALGFRHIDTAPAYGNEDEVGAAIAASGLARSDLFVTTKVWHDQLEPDALRRSFDSSLSKLGLSYVDLYLIHWPKPGMNLAATLEAMIRLKESGRTRAIGVCNFNLSMIRRAVEEIGAPIATNQVEYHPFLSQDKMLSYLRSKSISLTAYSPLARGRVTENATLIRIGLKHGASAAQIALASLLDQDGVIAIPKASRVETQKANLDALNIRLDDDDRAEIAALPKDVRLVRPSFEFDWDQ